MSRFSYTYLCAYIYTTTIQANAVLNLCDRADILCTLLTVVYFGDGTTAHDFLIERRCSCFSVSAFRFWAASGTLRPLGRRIRWNFGCCRRFGFIISIGNKWLEGLVWSYGGVPQLARMVL
jgi:hypothetical protein